MKTEILIGIITLVVAAGLGRIGYRWYCLLGFREISDDLKQLRALLNASMSKQQQGLILSGKFQGRPVTVMVSKAEDSPGLLISYPGKFRADFLVYPDKMNKPGLELIGATPRDRHFIYSWQAARAKNFLRIESFRNVVNKICSSREILMQITQDKCDVQEQMIPESLFRHCSFQLAATAELVAALEVKQTEKEKEAEGTAKWMQIAAGVVAAIGIGVGLMYYFNPSAATGIVAATEASSAPGLPGVSDSSGWRVATAEDFSAEAKTWLSSYSLEPTGELSADLEGTGKTMPVRILKGPEGGLRLVIQSKGTSLYDTNIESMVLVAVVSGSSLSSINWVKEPIEPPVGDGILLIQEVEKKRIAVVLYLSGGRVLSAVPVEPKQIKLKGK